LTQRKTEGSEGSDWIETAVQQQKKIMFHSKLDVSDEFEDWE